MRIQKSRAVTVIIILVFIISGCYDPVEKNQPLPEEEQRNAVPSANKP